MDRATAWYPLSNRAHQLELDWRAASAPTNTSGQLSVWVDGKLTGLRTGIQNRAAALDEVRLGPSMDLVQGMAGTEYYDDFSSARTIKVFDHQNYFPIIGGK